LVREVRERGKRKTGLKFMKVQRRGVPKLCRYHCPCSKREELGRTSKRALWGGQKTGKRGRAPCRSGPPQGLGRSAEKTKGEVKCQRQRSLRSESEVLEKGRRGKGLRTGPGEKKGHARPTLFLLSSVSEPGQLEGEVKVCLQYRASASVHPYWGHSTMSSPTRPHSGGKNGNRKTEEDVETEGGTDTALSVQTLEKKSGRG